MFEICDNTYSSAMIQSVGLVALDKKCSYWTISADLQTYCLFSSVYFTIFLHLANFFRCFARKYNSEEKIHTFIKMSFGITCWGFSFRNRIRNKTNRSEKYCNVFFNEIFDD